MDWFNGLPKLSKLYAASLVISGACLSYKIPAVFYMFLDWRAATYKLQVRQFKLASTVTCLTETLTSFLVELWR